MSKLREALKNPNNTLADKLDAIATAIEENKDDSDKKTKSLWERITGK